MCVVAKLMVHFKMLQVSFQTLSVRLSYNDIRLFMAIINSMPQQLLNAYPASQPKNSTSVGLC